MIIPDTLPAIVGAWMARYGLSVERAARYLSVLPQNVQWLLDDTARAHQRARVWPRLLVQRENMERRRCVIGRCRLK